MPPLNSDDSVLYFPPETFGPFRVLHQIGAGTLGPVFRAHEPDRDRLVAIKVFRVDITPEREGLLVQALAALVNAGLRHPGIAAPIGAGVEGNVVYLAQEYAVGDSLDVVLREQKPVPPADALPMVDQLADAIDAAARRGLHHGLLHPRDVLLTAEGPVVTGFGIAQALTQAGVRLPVRRPYSAPERVSGTDWGPPADVFALAAITHELMLGRRAAGTSDDAADPSSEVAALGGAALGEVLAAALATAPDARHRDARAFAVALRAAAEFEVLIAPPDPQPPTEEVAEVSETAAVPYGAATSEVPDGFPDERLMPDFHIDMEVGGSQPRTPPQPAAWSAPEPPTGPDMGARAEWRLRSAIAPAGIALIVGLLVGFLGGYSLGSRASGERDVKVDSPRALPDRVPERPAASTVPMAGVVPPLASDAPKAAALGRASRPAESAARPVTPTGRLQVRSTPAGARVAVNGQARGVTPLTVRELPLGSYTIRLMRDGYAAEEHQVRLTPDRTSVSLVVPLRRAAAAAREASGRGSLAVESRPAGARVFLDGRAAGTTPLAIADLPAGSVAVRIEQEGYQPWTSIVQIAAGERSRVRASLERREAK